MLVRRAKFNRIEPDLGQVLDDGRNVPVLGNVVGDRAKLQPAARGRRSGRSRRLPNRKRGHDRNGGEKVASIHGGRLQQSASSFQLPASRSARPATRTAGTIRSFED